MDFEIGQKVFSPPPYSYKDKVDGMTLYVQSVGRKWVHLSMSDRPDAVSFQKVDKEGCIEGMHTLVDNAYSRVYASEEEFLQSVKRCERNKKLRSVVADGIRKATEDQLHAIAQILGV
jgi:hypothetical protein